MAAQPESIGRYEVISTLGRGAMGVVYKALDPNIDRTVAVKVVAGWEFDSAPEGEEMRARFKREIQTSGLLTHSNIVTIYDGGELGELFYIAMEFIDGPSLRDVIVEKHDLSLGQRVIIMAKICAAMEFAHRRQIIHRDLKPANILLTSDLEPKVADFGIARVESSTMTKTGVILGTPSYMSPEQVTGQRIDYRSDIFSLGIIFYELLTGERPFTGENPTSIMYRIVHTDPVEPVQLNPQVPKECSDIAMRALAKRPGQRYKTAADMANALVRLSGNNTDLMFTTGRLDVETAALDSSRVDEALDAYNPSTLPEEAEDTDVSRKSRGGLFIGLLFIVLLGLGIWWLYESSRETAESDSGPARQDTPPAQEVTLQRPVSISVDQEGVTYSIDGQTVQPGADGLISVNGTQGSTVDIILSGDCFEDQVVTVPLDSTDTYSAAADLQPARRTVTITTVPEKAAIVVNDEERGEGPITVDLQCQEALVISASAAGYRPAEQEITWDSVDESNEVLLQLDPIQSGVVSFAGEYPVQVLRENGGQITSSRVTAVRLPPGKYNIRLTNREVFLNISRTIEVTEGGNHRIDLPGIGRLQVGAFPTGPVITINGFQLAADADTRDMRAAAGSIRVEFDWGEYQRTYNTELEAGGRVRIQGTWDRNNQ